MAFWDQTLICANTGRLKMAYSVLPRKCPARRKPRRVFAITNISSFHIIMCTYRPNRAGGFTLVEIMIVVAIIALLAAIAVPSALRARKRSQATSTLQTLRVLDAACDQWAIEAGKGTGSSPAGSNLQVYIKKNTKLYTELGSNRAYDAVGNPVTLPVVDTPPSIASSTYGSLSDVANSSFWGPYYTSGS